ncbi:extensin-like [Pyrus ussuriensis x Pyrus communis]|uniref:Extensin-like n=1 Tax=Pyrus ussuriensis x Pyrus communis TaxID=2448454 RepID=A0A5N5HT55_9ROSA|nr:extensin-like [Pyrus ussuriensis x Pyrus communis]
MCQKNTMGTRSGQPGTTARSGCALYPQRIIDLNRKQQIGNREHTWSSAAVEGPGDEASGLDAGPSGAGGLAVSGVGAAAGDLCFDFLLGAGEGTSVVVGASAAGAGVAGGGDVASGGELTGALAGGELTGDGNGGETVAVGGVAAGVGGVVAGVGGVAAGVGAAAGLDGADAGVGAGLGVATGDAGGVADGVAGVAVGAADGAWPPTPATRRQMSAMVKMLFRSISIRFAIAGFR